LFEIEHPEFPGQRLVACRNAELARRRAKKRQSLIEATIEELRKVQKMAESGRVKGKASIKKQVDKAVGKSRLSKHIRFVLRDDGFDVSIDEQRVVEEVTRTTVRELEQLQRRVKAGQLRGKHGISQRVTKSLDKRKVGKHFQVDVRDDGFDYTIDKAAVVEEVVAPLQRKLDKVRKRIKGGRLHGKGAIGVRVGKVINKYKVGKHFELDIRDDGFDFTINEDKVAAEAALDGVYVVRTSLPKERMGTAQTVRSYKLLTQVERAIRSMKTVDLRVRPIYHHLEKRVRAHFFLCMLAYYVQCHMMEAWRPLLFADEDQTAKESRDPVAATKRSEAARQKAATKQLDDGSPVHNFETLMGHLAGIVRNTCRRADAGPDQHTFFMTTPPNPKQREALELLKTIDV
jgi:transposase